MNKRTIIPDTKLKDEEQFLFEDIFELRYLHVVTGTTVSPAANVDIVVRGKYMSGHGTGNGPIGAVYNVIVQLTKSKAKLLKFSIEALGASEEAQGKVMISLEENGLIIHSEGVDSDIITASAKAYINGLNRLEYLKANPVYEA